MNQNEMREAFDAVYKEYGFSESFTNAYPAHCNQSLAFEIFVHGHQAATAAAEAKYLPVIEKLAEALRGSDELIEKAQRIMQANIIHGGVGNEDTIRDYIILLDNVYQRDVQKQTANALALAQPLLGGK